MELGEDGRKKTGRKEDGKRYHKINRQVRAKLSAVEDGG